MYDRMHLYFVKGIFYVEINALLAELNTCNLGFKEFRSYVALSTWPKAYKSGKTIVYDTNVNGPASEMMSIVPVLLRYLLSVVPAGKCSAQVASGIAFCAVVEMLCQHSSTSGRIAPDDLKHASLLHLSLHLAAYGRKWWLPKFHWASHLWEFLKRFGKLIGCFIWKDDTACCSVF